MNIKQMIPRHSVCNTELLIRFYFLTDDHCLLLRGICPKCKEQVEIAVSLTEMYQDCPEPPAVLTIMDVAYLAAMKITLPDAPQLPAK